MPFGGKRGEGTGITASNYLFTDQELDRESGLYNYDARLYDPIAGAFVSADTVVPDWFDSQSFNRFAYCRNNPLKYKDPTGHWFGIDDAFTGPVDELAVAGLLGIAAYGFGSKAAQDALNYMADKAKDLARQITVKDKIPNRDLLAPPSKRGNAPVGKDGHPVELHHPDQQNTDEREELSRTDHRGKGNFKKNHPNVGQEPSKIDRAKSKKDHRDYWGKEMDHGRFDGFDDKSDSDQSDGSEKSGNDDKGEVDSEEE
jgi:RHS repeat-associated protein